MISSRELSLRGKTADTSTAPGARGRFRRDHRRLRAENKNFLKNVLSNIPVQNRSVYQLVNIFEDIFALRMSCKPRKGTKVRLLQCQCMLRFSTAGESHGEA